jgi:hypothetical protein
VVNKFFFLYQNFENLFDFSLKPFVIEKKFLVLFRKNKE